MKKFIPFVLVGALLIGTFAGCGAAGGSGAGAAKTGYSVHTSIGSSKDATADAPGQVQVDTVVVYTTVGANGKIINTGIDTAQTRIPFDATGVIPADFDLNGAQKTKVEKGADYGMVKASKIGKEWFEQSSALAAWTVGKTPDEVVGLKTKKVDDNHQRVPDAADLNTTVSIDVGEYIDGVKAASANPLLGKEVKSGFKTGMGIVTSVAKSASVSADKPGVGQVDSVMAIVTLDKDGKIAQLRFDNAQTKVNFDATGKVTSDKAAPVKSKQQLKEEYGMLKASKIGKEWYQQADAFAEWCIGKTLDEVKGLKTKKVNDDHPSVPDVAELNSSVSITVNDYQAALEKAVANAK